MTTRRKLFLAAGLGLVALVLAAFEGEIGIALANQQPDDEARRLVGEMKVQDGDAIAEMGAGAGRLTVATARLLPNSSIYSTELSQERLADIRKAVREAGVRNVDVREAAVNGTNLPDGCCDAIFMRTVYHHFVSPPAMMAAVHQALKPGGRLAIIEFEPRGIWRWFAVPQDVPDRGGHGVPMPRLRQEVTAGGRFKHVQTVDRWAGRLYLMVFARDRT